MEIIRVKIFCLNKEFEIPKIAFKLDENEKPHAGGKLNLQYLDSTLIAQLSPYLDQHNGLITACVIN